MIQRLNNNPDHDPTLNNDSGQDSGETFPNETQIMNNNSRFRDDLPIWRKSPILRIFPSWYRDTPWNAWNCHYGSSMVDTMIFYTIITQLKLYCGYFYTRLCMINCIWGLETTMTTGEWSCLISFAWDPLSCSEQAGIEKFKMKIYVCSGIRTHQLRATTSDTAP